MTEFEDLAKLVSDSTKLDALEEGARLEEVKRINFEMREKLGVKGGLEELKLEKNLTTERYEWVNSEGKRINPGELLSDLNKGEITEFYKRAGIELPKELKAGMEASYQKSVYAEKPRYQKAITADKAKLKTTGEKIPTSEAELKKVSEANPEVKERLEKLEEKVKGGEGKLGKWAGVAVSGLLIAGQAFIAYKVLKAHQDRLNGCWKITQSAKGIEKCKISAFTCDSAASTKCSAGGCCGDWTRPVDSKTNTEITDLCGVGSSGECSKYCDCANLNVKCPAGVKYECINASLWDAFSDLTEDLAGTIEGAPGTALGLLEKLLKFLKDNLLLVGGVVMVVILLVVFSSMRGGSATVVRVKGGGD